MKILVLNCGSSTLKFQLIETAPGVNSAETDRKVARGLVDRVGGASNCTFELVGGKTEKRDGPIGNHEEAVREVIKRLNSEPELRDFEVVGHRIVHGGDRFASAVLIDDSVIETLETLSDLAPLHNPAGVSGIRAARAVLGRSIPMVAAFDTSFHHAMPEHASTYAIPWELSSKHRIRRYGFHGLAHQYAALRYADLTGMPIERINIVTLHLGNGSSACAIRGGQSVETSMGFTPLEGLVMGTRSGDLDPALVSYLARKEGVSVGEIENWLNNRSGLLGVSGLSSDMRELVANLNQNPRSRLAVEVFCHRARKYLGGYLAVLGGADAVIFSGGIGENSPWLREKICSDMQWCDLELDLEANAGLVGKDGRISVAGRKLQSFVVCTDEELIIAREAAALTGERAKHKRSTELS
ncbi:MAG: acetate/propionate family kinase [Candidatus Binatia bacterium]